MRDETIVDVRGVSKIYNIWTSPAARLRAPLLARIGGLPLLPEPVAKRLRASSRRSFRPFYALTDVSLQVRRNETVGIVGRNGSGKSTLLQLIAGTLAPTAGTVAVGGRVAALLELGSGFNPEFTGRENVQLNAAILGLSEAETRERFPEIEAFADVGDFIDQPVRTYSSGMYVRLAFAVAVNVDADLLIVDEALAVGDEAFQRKCFARLRRFQEGGGTILFVSHAASTVVEMCTRAVLLDHGEVLMAGAPKAVVAHYHKLMFSAPPRGGVVREEVRAAASGRPERPDAEPVAPAPAYVPDSGGGADFLDEALVPRSTVRYEPRGAVIEAPRITGPGDEPVNVVRRGHEYVYGYRVHFLETGFGVRFGMLLKTVSGFELGGGVSATPADAIACMEAGSVVRVAFRFRCRLHPGVYFLNAGVIGIVDGAEVYLHRLIDAVMLRVQPDREGLMTGLVDFEVRPEVSVEDHFLAHSSS